MKTKRKPSTAGYTVMSGALVMALGGGAGAETSDPRGRIEKCTFLFAKEGVALQTCIAKAGLRSAKTGRDTDISKCLAKFDAKWAKTLAKCPNEPMGSDSVQYELKENAVASGEIYSFGIHDQQHETCW